MKLVKTPKLPWFFPLLAWLHDWSAKRMQKAIEKRPEAKKWLAKQARALYGFNAKEETKRFVASHGLSFTPGKLQKSLKERSNRQKSKLKRKKAA